MPAWLLRWHRAAPVELSSARLLRSSLPSFGLREEAAGSRFCLEEMSCASGDVLGEALTPRLMAV